MAPPKNVFEAAAAHAAAYVQSVAERPIGATATVADLRTRLGGTLPQTPSDPVRVIDDLVLDVDGGIIGSPNPRFFGWVKSYTKGKASP